MNIRLEYSHARGQFNQAKATDTIDTANGFVTLGYFISQERAERFTGYIVAKYPALTERDALHHPSAKCLNQELLDFLAEDIRLLKQHMSDTFKRREATFSNLL